MMHSIQNSPRPDSFEVMAAAYAMASGLGHALRVTDEFARRSDAPGAQSALDGLRAICEEARKDSLELADLLWSTHRMLESAGSGITPSIKPFQRMLGEMREIEVEMDRSMSRHQVIYDIMMPLRRATAKARSNASLVVNVIRQMTPGEQKAFPGKADPEGLRELARVSTRLLKERFG